MRFVSPLLKKIVYPAMHRGGWLKRIATGPGCAVVNYHGVMPPGYDSRDRFLDGNLVTVENLGKQLRFLRTNYQVIEPMEFREWIQGGRPLPERSVLVTCDDGLVNNLVEMVPIFQSEGVRGLFFITGASCSETPGMLWYEELYQGMSSGLDDEEWRLLGTGGNMPDASGGFHATWWKTVQTMSGMSRNERVGAMNTVRDRRDKTAAAGDFDGRWRLVNIRELEQIAKSGMTIGAHTMSHPVLSRSTDGECFQEIAESKIALERAIGTVIWAFAYPFGNPDTMGVREVSLARRAGFECAFLNVGGGFSDRSQAFTFPRTHITADMSVAELEAHMIGFHARLQQAVRG